MEWFKRIAVLTATVVVLAAVSSPEAFASTQWRGIAVDLNLDPSVDRLFH